MQQIDIKKIKPNPNNPRVIKDDQFKKLVQSIKDFPEMLDARPLVINLDYMVLGGNQRLKALEEAGYKEVPCEVVDWSEKKQSEFIIKDNIANGEWDYDILANEWDNMELDAWGVDLDFGNDEKEEEEEAQISSELKVEVTCNSEKEQEELYNKLTEEGYQCRIFTL